MVHKHMKAYCVSYGCYNKSLQTWCLKTPEMHSLTVLEARSLKQVSLNQNQGVGRAIFPPESLERTYFLSLPDTGGCNHFLRSHPSDFCLCGHIAFSFVFVRSFSASYKERHWRCHLGPA